jgi:transposase
VARRLGVSRQTAHRWNALWREGGAGALEGSSTRGPQARLTDADVRTVAAVLLRGPRASGFSDDHWTCRQVGWVIERATGVSYHPAHVCRLIRRHGWSVDPPFTG